MEHPTAGRAHPRPALLVLVAFGLMSAALLSVGPKDYPDLHIILDTGMCLLSGVLAWQFWDASRRIGRLFLAWIGLTFAITSLLGLVHVLVTVEWSGPLAPIAQAANLLRSGTWPPAAYVLPVGIGASLWLMKRGEQRAPAFAAALLVLSAALWGVCYWLPRYTSGVWMGITRPTLILVPLLWTMVGWQCWRLRSRDRTLEPLALMAATLFLAHSTMLYSRSPHDTPAMVAHLGTVGGYLILLVSLVQMASQDMHERSNAERQLARLNEELERRVRERTAQLESANEWTRAIFETALDGIITMDHEGRIAEFNPAAERIFGYRRSEAIGRPLAEVIIPPEARELHRQGLARHLAGGEARVLGRRIELTGMRAGGSTVPVELSITRMPGNGPPSFVGSLRDITERMGERKAQAQLAAIIRSSDDAIISKTLDGIITSWNPGAQKLFGYSAEEALGKPMTMLIPPDRVHEERDILARIMRGDATEHFETVRVRKDGTPVDVSVTISPVRNDRGELTGASKIARDITERRHAELKLRAQLAKLDLLGRTTRAIGERQDLKSILQVAIRSLEDDLRIDFGCVCLYEPAQRVLNVACVGVKSQSLALQLAIPEQAQIEIDQNGLSRCLGGQLVHEPDITQSPFPFARRLAHAGLGSLVATPLMVESKVFGVVLAARRKAGQFSSGDCEFLLQLSEHLALALHQAELYGALQRAYEDLRQTQQSVMQQERLRALGQMASGVAHDINNALAPAALYTQSLLERDSSLSHEAKGYLVVIQRAIEDVANTVARMKEFYRRREPQLAHTSVDLNRVLEQVIELTRPRWSAMPQERGIVIRTQIIPAADLPAIVGAASEIRDALTNLILNAVDAMPQGGTLTLRTRSEPDQVQVEVTDTGIGMDEATRTRCLEPFFTTKGERGTGLGLAMVYGMLERHGGEIQIESEPGKGSSIRLMFPRAPTTAIRAGDSGVFPALQPAQPLRILFVDDDPIMLTSMRDILEQEGHLVVVADGGQRGIDAFRAARERGESFAVVITDLGMPHVDGRTVAVTVKSAAPDVAVILLTGWGHRLLAENDLPPGVDRVLSKPPKLAALRLALAELVTQPPP
jgi:PAS domain S-box-containing protein